MLDTVFVPAAKPAGSRLMIVLHGLGDSVEGFRWLPEAMQIPWLNYLLVNAPDSYYGGFAWYDLDEPHAGVERSRGLLAELLDAMRAKGFPTSQTILSGFSQGCLLSIEMATRYPHHFAGIVGISGYSLDPEKLVRELSPEAARQRFLLTHGTHDTLIPIARVRPQVEMLQRAGLQIEWREFAKEHTVAGEVEMSIIREFVQRCYA